MTSHPSHENNGSSKNVSQKVSAKRKISSGELGTFVLNNHAKYYDSTISLMVSYIIAKEFYNADEECAFPSEARIANVTGLKLRQVRTHIKNIREAKDEDGEPLWIIRTGYSVGGKSVNNRYFPRFIRHLHNPQPKVEEERQGKVTWDDASGFDPFGPTPYGTGSQDPKSVASKTATEAPSEGLVSAGEPLEAETPVTHSDRRVKTVRDLQILEGWGEAQKLRAEGHAGGISMPLDGKVVDVVSRIDVISMRDFDNPDKLFVYGTQQRWFEELAVDWIRRFGSKFGPTITYSTIQDVYSKLLDGVEAADKFTELDSAMCVLGSEGIMPTAGLVNLLLYFPKKLTPEQFLLHEKIHATVEGRDLSCTYMQRNLYGNFTPAGATDDSSTSEYANKW
jgi:hypothetical protein